MVNNLQCDNCDKKVKKYKYVSPIGEFCSHKCAVQYHCIEKVDENEKD